MVESNQIYTHQILEFEIEQDEVIEKSVWSQTGEWIALIFGSEKRTEVWLVDTMYADSFQVNYTPGKFLGVSWSPDSIAIIYNEELTNGSGKIHLFVVGVEWPFYLDMETSLDDAV